MAKKTEKKAPRKGSIAETVQHLLSLAAVPADDAIIARVKAAHKGTKFDEKHLAWYKSQFRQGKLTGQAAGRHTIAQKAEPKKHEPRQDKPKVSSKKPSGLKPKKRAEAPEPVEAGVAE